MIETSQDSFITLYTAYCDHPGCQESEDYDTEGSWQQLMTELRGDGWTYRKNDRGVYEHFCPVHPIRRQN